MKQYAIVMAESETFARPVGRGESPDSSYVDMHTGEIVNCAGAWVALESSDMNEVVDFFSRKYVQAS